MTFWRSSRDSSARHRYPLFDADVGVTPHRSLTVDVLHAWHLGVIKGFCCYVAWFILESSLLAGGACGTAEERFAVSVQSLKHQLFAFYLRRHESHPEENLTRACDLTANMFGESSARVLKLKGAECCFVLLFLSDFLRRAMRRLPAEARRYKEAADAIIGLMFVWKRAGTRLTDGEIADCWTHFNRFLTLTAHLDELQLPKRHVVSHMLERLHDFGNPMAYANWYDEHLNKLLKKACQAVSQQTFEAGLIQRMRFLLEDELDRV